MNFIYKYWNDIDEIKEEKKIILGIISLSSGSFVSFSNSCVWEKQNKSFLSASTTTKIKK